jgi:hypothetical protein
VSDESVNVDLDTICICGATFHNKGNLNRHKKTCRNKTKEDIITESLSTVSNELSQLKNNTVFDRLNALENHVVSLKEEVEILKETLNSRHKGVYMQSDIDYDMILNSNSKRASQWIYFISDGEFIKIGKASKLSSRLSTLQTGSASDLKILAYIETNNMDKTEKIFHKHLQTLRIRGEWFSINYDMVEEMLISYRNFNELPELPDMDDEISS